MFKCILCDNTFSSNSRLINHENRKTACISNNQIFNLLNKKQKQIDDLKSKLQRLQPIEMVTNFKVDDLVKSISLIPDILKDKDVLNWIKYEDYWNDVKKTKTNSDKEKEFGLSIIKKYYDKNYTDTVQWTTKFGQEIVKSLFQANGHNVYIPKKINNYIPDWETDDYVIEVKTRSYCISGTAGEKVLGCPLKYSDVPKLYKKPLLIILVAYQEVEAIKYFKLFDKNCSIEKQKILTLYEDIGIHYICASKLCNFDL